MSGDRKYNPDDNFTGRRNTSDDPPNSRLFIVSNKSLTEDDFREAFAKFGNIEEIWVVKDRQTGERKGVTYIKYSKTSEAAAAMEEMHGRTLGNSNRHIKVMIASKRDQGSVREGNEEERILRLFIIVPKTMTDDDVHDYFKQFGEIDYASVVKDKETRDSKGFAYVKYFKFSHAANAYENCDKKFKAVFAEPRNKSKNTFDDSQNYGGNMGGGGMGNMGGGGRGMGGGSFNKSPINALYSLDMIPSTGLDGYTRLMVLTSPQLTQDQLWKLFDIIPGLEYCELQSQPRGRGPRGQALVVYSNPQAAAYAREKLHGFEYPPGARLIIRPDYDQQFVRNNDKFDASAASGSNRNVQSDLAHLADTIAQATKLIKAAGLTPEALMSSTGDNSFCSVNLPPTQPLAPIDAPVEARCFIVCTPHPPPVVVLRDAFCRFGSLIDVYMLTNRNCGYVKYAQKQSAEQARQTLHGAEICGIRLKVLEAEERQEDERRKRQRVDS
ncbi:RNA-binding protein 45 [Chrysoperla carnea]|uniref:RNA-binding protein 45 n=1 Tax=Chrysoperla carnea TaxID=189513 RepID=UPI001D05C722|nr:RNA-binding protein 45 [Chrysoperla carnea]